MRKIAARMPTGTARGSQASSVKRSERRFMICTFFQEPSDALSLVYIRFSEGKIKCMISSSSTKPVGEAGIVAKWLIFRPGSFFAYAPKAETRAKKRHRE